ncbi:MAG: hypothetical protein K5894_00405, partial [Lachnospiraceae bacterium]|nr:hypothetical protein [Lachnospiraceae bacterium]
MMIKKLAAVLSALMIFSMTACASTGEGGAVLKNSDQTTGVADILAERTAEEDASSATAISNGETSSTEAVSETTESAATEERQSGVSEGAPAPEVTDDSNIELSDTEGIDIDLTKLSSLVVYSEVYNMMV